MGVACTLCACRHAWGRPEKYPKREILDAIFYILRGGCAWRLLPHDFPPPWQIVYQYLWGWRQDGKHRQRSAGILESPSVKTTGKRGPRR